MSKFPVSPYWSSNPNIPICLDTGDTSDGPEPEKSREYTCPTCETSSKDQPIHCVSLSPSTPSCNAIASPAPSSQHLVVPNLSLETPKNWSRPHAPRPALQFDPKGRPQVRFRRNAFSPLSPPNNNGDSIDWNQRVQDGSGIPDAIFKPNTSLITPSLVEKRGEEREEEDLQSASNFAQRIEQKWWEYSASRNVVKRWLPEIISWTISATCMAGIAIILFVYKSKRIPSWPSGLTLDGCISLLAKIASAALLLPVSEALGQLKWSWFRGDNSRKMWDFEIFDNASRGAWGSLLLLVRTKGRSLAALGAAVTLLALALDPFFQQVVVYPERWRLQEETGLIARAIGYEPFSSGKEYKADLENLEVDADMHAATYHYFYNNGTSPITFGKGVRAEVPLGCPNSNCTWPAYETLGVCNECVKAADLLEFMCINTTLDWIQSPPIDLETEVVAYANGTSCGWYLKVDDPLLMTGYDVDRNTANAGEVLFTRAQPLYDVNTREFLPGYIPKLNNSRNPLAHFIVASGKSLNDIQRNATPIAHECMISWCVKTIMSTYSEGGYTEEVLKTVVNDTVESSPWTIIKTYNKNNELDGVDYYYLENVTVKGTSEVIYSIDNRTHLLTLSVFDDIFPSEFVLANSTNEDDAMLRYKQYNVVSPYTRNLTYNPWLYENVTTHMDNLANAMTNLMRSALSDTDMTAGSSFDKESIVDVRWVWLTLPLGLLALTGIFLLATVVRSSRESEHVGVWKTSAIAMILYGLPDEMQKKLTLSKVIGIPRAKAKEVKMKWLSNRGWRFSGNSTGSASPSLKSNASIRSWV
ncbi:hypothetical protein BDV96DRAFT_517232 [Lophiotrema nucula]|uniref:DUF3176 domain containing protein n=1 Tax=Lophiotrema nucula TaxID=690887 RepID=A0A6A5ZEC5_9PLEO|nr:hypothetical protein BDV96DRAFT_517232 [Lophiotrema nucula]